jgi:hypothetical protein
MRVQIELFEEGIGEDLIGHGLVCQEVSGPRLALVGQNGW